MSRFQFDLASTDDDADLRHILAATPMDGRVRVSFRREPSYFEASVVDGTWRQIVVARDCSTGHVVGFGSRSVREMFVNGRPQPIGYLSNLRLLPEYRSRGLVARGYAYFRNLHTDGRTNLYLTTIAEGNHRAVELLTSRRTGLPTYHAAGRFFTFVILLTGRRRTADRTPEGLNVRSATAGDLAQMVRFIGAEGPRRQFFPCYGSDDFFGPQRTFRDLRPQDVLLAFRHKELVAALGLWDQHRFRQTVVEGYTGPLYWTRPFYNCYARLFNMPSLPCRGDWFRYVTAAMPVVHEDDPLVLSMLLNAARAVRGRDAGAYLTIGLHENDPLLPMVRRQATAQYITRLYLVCWDDGEQVLQQLDDRPPYLELGCL